ncbi:stress transcription factor A [Seminavis robusta]|uniref:Stress transcription factor A n=1 Tax=Seminavis robusta TaxID=568900 RepID=A0A9N8EUB1_9STRA|nr:stress transcription factor A [Seminavis robusta]|eukprot:Sro1985_g309460.1 stress transcription factor A (318) ;mRNA; f:15157-16302
MLFVKSESHSVIFISHKVDTLICPACSKPKTNLETLWLCYATRSLRKPTISNNSTIMSDTEKETSSTTGSVPPLLLDDENNDSGNTLYKYRDFSTMPEEPDNEDESNNNQRGSLESSIRVQKFPVKLYAILAQKEFHDIITWMPHGRSWKVLKPNLFESMVMPLFFEYSNYHSFNRLVNAWSFRRISSGPDRGSYYHELFLRGKPHLQKYMRRLPKTHKKLPMKKEDEPDFYKMDKENSLPPLEEIQLSAPKMRGGMAGMGAQQPLAFTPVAHKASNVPMACLACSQKASPLRIISMPRMVASLAEEAKVEALLDTA